MSMSPQIRLRRFNLAVLLARIAGVACFCLLARVILRRASDFLHVTDGGRLLGLLAALLLFCVGPGSAYLLLAPRIRVGSRVTLVTIVVVASIQLLITLLGILVQIILEGPRVNLGVPLAFALLLVILIVQACLCLAARKRLLRSPRGFEPVMPSARRGPQPTIHPISSD
jgi:hypothetical protein